MLQRVYDLLGVTFDSYNGEAFYEDKMPAVVQELKDKGLTKIGQRHDHCRSLRI